MDIEVKRRRLARHSTDDDAVRVVRSDSDPPTGAGKRFAPMAITIRPYALEDAVQIWEAAHESITEVRPWMPWCHPGYSVEESRAWLRAQAEWRRNGTAFEFAITSAAGRYLGGCGLNQIDSENRRANLGYWLRTGAAGRGVMPRAVHLLREWAFENTNLIRLEIVVAVNNTRSQRVAEKVEAKREGVLRSRLLLHGQAHDAVMFSITR
jgi:RimJ/RimL family protein N-acetyltransferase